MTCWSASFVSYEDDLVHLVNEHYAAQVVEGHLLMAFTRCGNAVTWDGVHASGGRYVAADVPLTCVRCVGGVRDGSGRRQAMKSVMFAQMYGRSPGNIGSLAAVDAAVAFGLRTRSIFRRCTRVAQVLYLKATEYPRA